MNYIECRKDPFIGYFLYARIVQNQLVFAVYPKDYNVTSFQVKWDKEQMVKSLKEDVDFLENIYNTKLGKLILL